MKHQEHEFLSIESTPYLQNTLVYKDDDYEAPCSIETIKLMYPLLSPLEKTLIGSKTLGWSNRRIAKRLKIPPTEINYLMKRLIKKIKQLFTLDVNEFTKLNVKKFKAEHKQLFMRCKYEKIHCKCFL